MFMEKCDEWLRSEAVKKFKFLTAREELIALEFAAWLNQQSAQQSFAADGLESEPKCLCPADGLYPGCPIHGRRRR